MYTANFGAYAGDEEEQDEDNPVSNVRVTKQGKINIFFEYDLTGEPDETYTISLSVRLQSDTSYSYTPINVIGDIGSNIRPGKNKRISWRISDEDVSALDKQDVQFIIRGTAPKSEGGHTELYVVGGAAVVGLTLAIVLLSANKADDVQGSNVFPAPPGRPR
jgi:hypothetical protein